MGKTGGVDAGFWLDRVRHLASLDKTAREEGGEEISREQNRFNFSGGPRVKFPHVVCI